jgi:serine/threonine protein kinase
MSLQPGERFGRYELVSWLGRGGMAETYRARLLGEAGVTKPVLIKKVLPEYTNDQAFIAMFISEARISATLSHGNIAQVYDFGRVDGDYFLAMEYVDGQPLHKILKRMRKFNLRTVPTPLAAFITLELCRGLHYAHTRSDDKGQPLSIVHRDISPDNVLVSYEGQVKIVDFGIAKARELREFSTEPGIVKGKYLFFSPEQAAGEDVDARTDVWATGIVLYEMLCGKLPVEDSPEVAMPQLMEGKFPRPRELAPISEELDSIVMQALAVRKEDRYPSCHAFGDALATYLAATAPRFSAMSLSHFVQQLFRNEIVQSGRPVQVPESFQEQFSQWRGLAPARATTPTTPGRSQSPSGAAPDPLAKTDSTSQIDTAPDEASAHTTPVSAQGSTGSKGSITEADTAAVQASIPTKLMDVQGAPRRKGKPAVAAVAGVVVLGGLLAGSFLWVRSRSQAEPLQRAEVPSVPSVDPVVSPPPAAPAAAEEPKQPQAAPATAANEPAPAEPTPSQDQAPAAPAPEPVAVAEQPGSDEAGKGQGAEGSGSDAAAATPEEPSPSGRLAPGCYTAVVAFESSRLKKGSFGPWTPTSVTSRTEIPCSTVPRQGTTALSKDLLKLWPSASLGTPLHYTPQSFEPQKKGDPNTRRMVVKMYSQISE